MDLEELNETIIERIIGRYYEDGYREHVYFENGEVVINWERIVNLSIGKEWERNLYKEVIRGLLLLGVLSLRKRDGYRLVRDNDLCRNLFFWDRYTYFKREGDIEQYKQILERKTKKHYEIAASTELSLPSR